MGRSRVWVFGVVLAVAVAYACMDADVGGPFAVGGGPAFELTADPTSGPGSSGLLGAAGLPTPPNNTVATAWFNTGVPLPAGMAVRVKVEGKLTFSPNPAYRLCAGTDPPPLPGGLTSVGPAGVSGPSRPYSVHVGIGTSGGPGGEIALQPIDPNAGATEAVIQATGLLWASRPTVLPYACGSGGATQPAYFVSGLQSLTVTTLDSAYVTTDRVEVPAGDTVLFQVVAPS
ncbi:MAG: hypothetical protein HYS40_05495 [Gemmatimonadetes bacterium]|nr:hypothetical protein [Gemmatimonadota bacterium]